MSDREPGQADEHDVFLCHNSDDKEAVQAVANALWNVGLKPWLDRDGIRPGDRIARVLEQQIRTAKAAAVFVGKTGEGPWQTEEIDALLGEAARRGCRLIPVLLPSCPKEPPLPVFMKSRRWVDFRVAEPDPISELIWGITGKKPGQVRTTGRAVSPPQRSVPARDEDLHAEQPMLADTEPVSTSTENTPAALPLVTDGKPSRSDEFDVFLSHNSKDKEEVREVAKRLRALGLNPWIDDVDLRAGSPSASALEQQIGKSMAAAVFVGANGLGRWQSLEIAMFLQEYAERAFPVIPVLLRSGTGRPELLPKSLRTFSWVDLGQSDPDPIKRLYHGITGKKLEEDQTTDEVVAPSKRGWTRHSTVESVKAERVSVLAILDTLIAVVVYALLAWRLGALRVMFSAVVSLFFVLRTKRSVELSWKWYEALFPLKDRESRRPPLIENRRDGIPMLLVGGIYLWTTSIINALLMLAIRVGATMGTFLWHPIECFKEVPQNWIRAIFHVDVSFPLELLPEANQRHGHRELDGLTQLTLMPGKGIKLQLSNTKGIVERILLIIISPVLGILFWMPSLIYRLYVKGAFIIYFPLMFAFYMSAGGSLQDRIQNIIKRDFHRGIRGFAAIAAGLLVMKSYLYFAWDDLSRWWYAFPGHHQLEAVVAPDSFPPWQFALCVIIFNVWVLYWWADWIVDRLNSQSLEHPVRAEAFWRMLTAVQWLLCIYVVLCWIYLAVSHSSRFGLPPLGTHLLPWL